jgi:uncharacterized membrane protein YhaH (DUF805 family)
VSRIFGGTCGRKEFWIGIAIYFGLKTALVLLSQSYPFLLNAGDFILLLVAGLLGRRFRDFGWSAAWGWATVFVFSFALPLAIVIATSRVDGPGSSFQTTFINSGAFWATIPLYLVILFAGLKKGNRPSMDRASSVF